MGAIRVTWPHDTVHETEKLEMFCSDIVDRLSFYDELWARQGVRHQVGMLIEECAELIEAICHVERGRSQVMDHIFEETGDVMIVAEQILSLRNPSLVRFAPSLASTHPEPESVAGLLRSIRRQCGITIAHADAALSHFGNDTQISSEDFFRHAGDDFIEKTIRSLHETLFFWAATFGSGIADIMQSKLERLHRRIEEAQRIEDLKSDSLVDYATPRNSGLYSILP